MNYQWSRKNLILGSSFGTLIILCAAFAPVLGETETSEGFFAQLWDSIFGSKSSVASNETVVKNDTVSEPFLKTTELPIRPTGDNETITDSTAAPTLSSTVPQGTTGQQDGSSTTTPRSNKTEQTDKEDSSSSPTTLSTAAVSSMTTDNANSATTIVNSSDSVGNATTISTTNDPIATTSASPNKTS